MGKVKIKMCSIRFYPQIGFQAVGLHVAISWPNMLSPSHACFVLPKEKTCSFSISPIPSSKWSMSRSHFDIFAAQKVPWPWLTLSHCGAPCQIYEGASHGAYWCCSQHCFLETPCQNLHFAGSFALWPQGSLPFSCWHLNLPLSNSNRPSSLLTHR